MSILVLNHCSHNKGDNSVLYYLIRAITSLCKDTVPLTVSCSDSDLPFWWERDNSFVVPWPGGDIFKNPNLSFVDNLKRRIRFFLYRRFIYRLFIYLYARRHDKIAVFLARLSFNKSLVESVKSSEIIFCSGGHHISDVLERDCINPQLVALALAELFGKKTILWSQSIGPIDGASSISKLAMARVFNSAKSIYVRDKLSAECVKAVSNASVLEVPDSVFLAGDGVDADFGDEKVIVCAVYTAGVTDRSYLKKYLDAWGRLCKLLVASGYRVLFVPMQYKGYGGDERAFLSELVESCGVDGVGYLDEDLSPKDTIEVFRRATCVVGHKTHSVIYGLVLNKPTVAISYHEKTNYFMSLFGYEDYSFPEVIGCEELIFDKVLDAVSRHSEVRDVNSLQCRKFREGLEAEIRASMGVMG